MQQQVGAEISWVKKMDLEDFKKMLLLFFKMPLSDKK